MINEKDWRIYASSVRSSIVVIMLFSIVKSVLDFVGGLGSAVGDLMSFIESGTVDFGTDMFDIIGYVATFIIVIAYFTYMSGLGSFAKIQANEDDARGVRRIRSGMVWTLLATLVDYIPTVGGFISFLFLFIAFFVLLSKLYGYGVIIAGLLIGAIIKPRSNRMIALAVKGTGSMQQHIAGELAVVYKQIPESAKENDDRQHQRHENAYSFFHCSLHFDKISH